MVRSLTSERPVRVSTSFFLYTIGNTTSETESAGKDTEDIIRHIITSSRLTTKCFLFVETGPVTKRVLKDILTLFTIADKAFLNGWYTVYHTINK